MKRHSTGNVRPGDGAERGGPAGPVLANRFRDGDHEVIGRLYLGYRDALLAVCRKFADDRRDPEDVLHGAWIRIIERCHTFSGVGYPYSWMRTICHNYGASLHRRSRLDIDPGHDVDSLPGVSDPEGELLARERSDALSRITKKAMSALSRTQRRVVWMRLRDHMAFKEIADVLGSREGTVRVMYHRAVKKAAESMAVGTLRGDPGKKESGPWS